MAAAIALLGVLCGAGLGALVVYVNLLIVSRKRRRKHSTGANIRT